MEYWTLWLVVLVYAHTYTHTQEMLWYASHAASRCFKYRQSRSWKRLIKVPTSTTRHATLSRFLATHTTCMNAATVSNTGPCCQGRIGGETLPIITLVPTGMNMIDLGLPWRRLMTRRGTLMLFSRLQKCQLQMEHSGLSNLGAGVMNKHLITNQ